MPITNRVQKMDAPQERPDVVWRKVDELTKLEINPRKITEAEMERLKRSIKRNQKFFSANPLILSDRTGELVIIGGNQRLEAAKQLGLEEVPTILMHNPTEREEREAVILDNNNNGENDVDKLLANFGDLDLKELMGKDYNFDTMTDEELDGFFGRDDSAGDKKPKEVTCPHCGKKFEI